MAANNTGLNELLYIFSEKMNPIKSGMPGTGSVSPMRLQRRQKQQAFGGRLCLCASVSMYIWPFTV